MNTRTSITDPIKIDEIQLCHGRLGLIFCPGKKGKSVFGKPWERDLQVDLEAVCQWGASTIITVMEESELAMLGVKELSSQGPSRGINWVHLPVQDLKAPDQKAEKVWSDVSPHLVTRLANGEKILIHCRGGLGRTGTIAAMLLMENGSSCSEAVKIVRAARPGAIETLEQEAYLQRHRPYLVHASLLAGALGDSMGADIEFQSLGEIRRRFPETVNQLAKSCAPTGWFTDDTQMTLFTAEGFLDCARDATISAQTKSVHDALERWLTTQLQPRPGQGAMGLAANPDLYFRAASGMTCQSALKANSTPGAPAQNNSKGCGTIMRVAPIAFAVDRSNVRELAIKTSALTHGHITGQLAASAWAELLADVAAGKDLEEMAQTLAEAYATLGSGGKDVGAAMVRALDAPRNGKPETVETLGGGWVAEEALSIALYASLVGHSLDEGLQIALRHSGDCDSTAAISGNMLGLLYPEEVFAHPLIGELGGRDIIAPLAVGLALRAFGLRSAS
jgi:ADP-ribosylglycohydrolase/protein-tyrosine phosphatase